ARAPFVPIVTTETSNSKFEEDSERKKNPCSAPTCHRHGRLCPISPLTKRKPRQFSTTYKNASRYIRGKKKILGLAPYPQTHSLPHERSLRHHSLCTKTIISSA
ncbi:unnamed protein product, partial [Ectocarpus sp. 6 AP-2014]